MKISIKSVRDLVVYQKLVQLHLDVDKLTMNFPKHELYELGSQVRRSSNAVPAILAEGWNNRHTKVYLEAINRAIGEAQETRHHIGVAFQKQYVEPHLHATLLTRYDECIRMLWGLARGVSRTAVAPRPLTSHLSPHTSDASA